MLSQGRASNLQKSSHLRPEAEGTTHSLLRKLRTTSPPLPHSSYRNDLTLLVTSGEGDNETSGNFPSRSQVSTVSEEEG